MAHNTSIAGVKFRDGAEGLLRGMREGTTLALEREPSNRYDRNAIKVMFGSD